MQIPDDGKPALKLFITKSHIQCIPIHPEILLNGFLENVDFYYKL